MKRRVTITLEIDSDTAYVEKCLMIMKDKTGATVLINHEENESIYFTWKSVYERFNMVID